LGGGGSKKALFKWEKKCQNRQKKGVFWGVWTKIPKIGQNPEKSRFWGIFGVFGKNGHFWGFFLVFR
jgi:hypothetical protein